MSGPLVGSRAGFSKPWLGQRGSARPGEHRERDGVHMHVLAARCDLETGKSLNIALARLAEDTRPVARRLQPRARPERARRPGPRQGGRAPRPRLHRRGEPAGRSGGRELAAADRATQRWYFGEVEQRFRGSGTRIPAKWNARRLRATPGSAAWPSASAVGACAARGPSTRYRPAGRAGSSKLSAAASSVSSCFWKASAIAPSFMALSLLSVCSIDGSLGRGH